MFNINWFSSSSKISYIGFEDMKIAIAKKHIFINTLSFNEQHCLIQGTILAKDEENVVNEYLLKDEDTTIFVYGRNSSDKSADSKYCQLRKLGFENVHIYSGGLFEWLLLQNIYGESEFPTTSFCKDLLQYRALPLPI